VPLEPQLAPLQQDVPQVSSQGMSLHARSVVASLHTESERHGKSAKQTGVVQTSKPGSPWLSPEVSVSSSGPVDAQQAVKRTTRKGDIMIMDEFLFFMAASCMDAGATGVPACTAGKQAHFPARRAGCATSWHKVTKREAGRILFIKRKPAAIGGTVHGMNIAYDCSLTVKE
jgi:hypothetical protein